MRWQGCLFYSILDPDKAKKVIKQKVSEKELEMMKKFGLDDGDGFITRSEFSSLCAVRLGAMDKGLIGAINERFGELDSGNDGCISYEDLVQEGRSKELLVDSMDHDAQNNSSFCCGRFSGMMTLSNSNVEKKRNISSIAPDPQFLAKN